MSLIRKMGPSSADLPSPPSSSTKENWTITCYSCGMPSSSVWAKRIRCHPEPSSSKSTPYFPHFLELPCPNGAILQDDGSTHLCAFCFAALESQWNTYEKQEDSVRPSERKYNLQKFICAVCGVSTYRKRIRALPFQEFPFLTKDRQPGSLTLGQNPLAIVCLDCSETLWAQSAEYERWGLPIQKRHFNWMARPPPPENSMEATVARLPSGETQLPRCPPVEPSVTKGRPHLYSDLTSPQNMQTETKNNKVDLNRRNSRTVNVPTSRKSSVPCLSDSPQFPPVVTVAPMASHQDSVSVRKNSTTSIPSQPLALDLFKSDSNGSSSDSFPSPLGYTLNNGKKLIPNFLDSPTTYNALQWPYPSMETSQTNPWPWIPATHHRTTDYVNYQTYLAAVASRSFGATESYMPPPPLIYSHTSSSVSQNPLAFTSSFKSPLPNGEDGHYFTAPTNQSSYPTPQLSNGLNTHDTRSRISPEVSQPQKRKGSVSGTGDFPSKSSSKRTKSESQTSSTDKRDSNGYSVEPKFKSTSSTGEKLSFPKSSHTSSPINLKKRWTEEAANDNFAVDLRKKNELTNSTSSQGRTRSSSFSIAFLCNDSSLSPKPKTNPRDSVIVSPANTQEISLDDRELVTGKSKSMTGLKDMEDRASLPKPKSPESETMPSIQVIESEQAVTKRTPSPKSVAMSMTDEQVKAFAEEAKAAYKLKEREHRLQKKREDEKKEHFLEPFDLITSKRTSEIELKKTISRAERRTLAPLVVQPDSPKDDTAVLLQREIRQAISECKFPEGNQIPAEQQTFLQNLGLKSTLQAEKHRVKQQWCLRLLEKLLRVSRSHSEKEVPWTAEELSKLVTELASICHVNPATGIQQNEALGNLSLTLTPEAEDLLSQHPGLFNSSDLLSIATSCPSEQGLHAENLNSKLAIISPVITYPKYIPSFANVENDKADRADEGKPPSPPHSNPNILNIPNIMRHSEEHDPTTANVPSICIPKIPIRRSSSSESSYCENLNPDHDSQPKRVVQRKDSADGKLVQVDTNTGTMSKQPATNHSKMAPDADDIIGRYTELLKGLRNEMDNLLSSTLTSTKEEKNGENHAIDQIRKLRSALASYQSEMKLMERKLRKSEKEMTRSRGDLEKNTHSHCIQMQATNVKLGL